MAASSILCTGWATKRGAVKKNWKRRYFVLRSDCTLAYYKDGWSPNVKPQGIIQVEPGMTFTVGALCSSAIDWPPTSSENTRFQLGTPSRTYYIFCDTPEAAMGWITKIRALSQAAALPGQIAAVKTAPDMSAEEQQALHDRVKQLAREDGNRHCFDCGAKGAQPWASWNIGAFLCMRCAGIHRSLGVHVSKVKSVTLDSWPPEHVAALERMGNAQAAALWEATLPADFERPQEKAELERFISQKYVTRKWAADQRRPSRATSLAHPSESAPQEGFNPFNNSDSEDDVFPTNFTSSAAPTVPAGPPPTLPPPGSGTPQETARRASIALAEASSAAAAADPMAAHQWT